jgi:acyl-CoA thioesterase FadM
MFLSSTTTSTGRIRASPARSSFSSVRLLQTSTQKADTLSSSPSEQQEEETTSTISFTTPPMQVYIEDTDAYGIMYNSNYLRSFDRALHVTTTQYNTTNKQRDANRSIRISEQHEGWSIVSVGKQRFGASPRLGEDFVIEGTLQRMNEDDSEEVWDMEMKSLDGKTVYNWVKDVTIQVMEQQAKDNDDHDEHPSRPTQALHSSLEDISQFDMDSIKPNFMCKEDYFTVYRDEIDAHWQGHLPLRNVLNLFERSRTNALGGPDGLRRMQEDDENAVVVVVTGVSDLTLIDEGTMLIPGQVVAVETAMVVKRRGMVVECYQTLRSTPGSSDVGDSAGKDKEADCSTARLAQGKVTLMMLDAKTRRPTTKLPGWARELLQVESLQ